MAKSEAGKLKLRTRQTPRGPITYEEAADSEADMLTKLEEYENLRNFCYHCFQNLPHIQNVVANHLGLRNGAFCRASPVSEWSWGSFNLVIPLDIRDRRSNLVKRVIIRFPLDHKTGEKYFQGNSDEKLRCEAATYIWMRENCPDVPIPLLLGFAFSKGRAFYSLSVSSITCRWLHRLRLVTRWLLGKKVPCHEYIARDNPHHLRHGYLLLEFIEPTKGTMLSKQWDQRHNDRLRKNLLVDLSRIMLSITRTPLLRIGSLTIDDDGILSLTNRPLVDQIALLEGCGIPSNIKPTQTYPAAESFMLDILKYHDNRLIHQPNAVNDEADGRQQMAVLSLMRVLLPHFTLQAFRNGPFYLALTDLHRSNILVDQEWHIKSIIDLEWACSLPVEMIRPPDCLMHGSPDEMTGLELENYKTLRNEFMYHLQQEERLRALPAGMPLPLSQVMEATWENGGYFYFMGLGTVSALYQVFEQHVRPLFSPSRDFGELIPQFWGRTAAGILSTKIENKANYDARLLDAFKE